MSKTGDISLEHIMSCELRPFLASLFEAKGFLLKSGKTQLSHAIENLRQSFLAVANQGLPYRIAHTNDVGKPLIPR